ncbi:MAG: pentapeptide repeat-containing protein [Candidatus Nitrosopolaris sp.]|jgi:hypothetical protein
MARFIEQEKKDDTRKEEDRINTKERENEEIQEEELGSSLKLANLGGADFNTIDFSEANFKEIANFNFGEFFRIANFKGTNFSKGVSLVKLNSTERLISLQLSLEERRGLPEPTSQNMQPSLLQSSLIKHISKTSSRKGKQ